jgi:carbamoyltransferase
MKNPIYILGISAFYHDSAACLVRDGEIIAAAQEERFSRIKHDQSFPHKAVEYCLKEAGISIDQVQYVGFYEKPFLKFERLLLTYLTYAPVGLRSFSKAMPVWLREKIFIKDLIAKELNTSAEILFCQHHESHAGSAFYPSPFKKAAILTMDGTGEWATTTIGVGEGCNLKLIKEIRFPHSLGLLYSAFTYYTGFRVNSGEYKLMGLAPYGEPKYVDLIKQYLIDIKPDGSFKLNMDYFNYPAGLTMTNARFNRLFGGKPRRAESPITQKDMDIARSIQEVTEELMVSMAKYVHTLTGEDNLCLAGGVALNCVGNGKILKKTPFKNIWVQPAAGDAGGALGVALIIWHQHLKKSRHVNESADLQCGSYLGPDQSEAIKQFVDTQGAHCEHINDQKLLAKRVAALIAEQNTIGLFYGRMEFGPRALGGRSIIADARSETMQSALNLKIKFRESFRPFAPSVLREKVSDYFDLHSDSPYMLMVADVRADKRLSIEDKNHEGIAKLNLKRSLIPAVTHVDYSARIQTVDGESNPFYYDIIKAFDELTGCPVIINTSFNVRGEPIVCTPADAYRCFMSTNLDYLVMGPYLFDKTKQIGREKYKIEHISRILD